MHHVHFRQFSAVIRRLDAQDIPRITAVSVKPKTTSVDTVTVTWSDGNHSKFPSLYLRDNHADGKSINGQKDFDTNALTAYQTTIANLDDSGTTDKPADEQAIKIHWNDHQEQTYSAEWLFQNSLNEQHRLQRKKDLFSHHSLWDAEWTLRPTCNFSDIRKKRTEFDDDMVRFGVVLVDQAPTELQYDVNGDPPVVTVGMDLGFIRETNFGRHWDVRHKAVEDINDISFTNSSIPLHTDNPFRDPTPGIQSFHCIQQAFAEGQNESEDDGSSLLVDGFKVAVDLQKEHPRAFDLLSKHKRPFTYYDMKIGEMYSVQRPVISIDSDGSVCAVYWSNHNASSMNWDIAEDLVEEYYEAWNMFANLCNSPRYIVKFRLQPGEIFFTNNLRVLHGRNSFGSVKNSQRHLQGCWIDLDTVFARYNGRGFAKWKQQ